MKLREFNSKNTSGLTKSRNNPSIHMHYKTGVISINCAAAEMLNISDAKCYISVFSDEETDDWYLKVSRDPNGFKLRIKDGSGTYSFNSVEICRRVLSSHNGNILKSGSFRISPSPVSYNGFDIHPIITSDPLMFRLLDKQPEK